MLAKGSLLDGDMWIGMSRKLSIAQATLETLGAQKLFFHRKKAHGADIGTMPTSDYQGDKTEILMRHFADPIEKLRYQYSRTKGRYRSVSLWDSHSFSPLKCLLYATQEYRRSKTNYSYWLLPVFMESFRVSKQETPLPIGQTFASRYQRSSFYCACQDGSIRETLLCAPNIAVHC